MKKFKVTDIIGQPHVFTQYVEKTIDGKKKLVGETLRLHSRKFLIVEADKLPEEIRAEEKLGFVYVEDIKSTQTIKSAKSTKEVVQ